MLCVESSVSAPESLVGLVAMIPSGMWACETTAPPVPPTMREWLVDLIGQKLAATTGWWRLSSLKYADWSPEAWQSALGAVEGWSIDTWLMVPPRGLDTMPAAGWKKLMPKLTACSTSNVPEENAKCTKFYNGMTGWHKTYLGRLCPQEFELFEVQRSILITADERLALERLIEANWSKEAWLAALLEDDRLFKSKSAVYAVPLRGWRKLPLEGWKSLPFVVYQALPVEVWRCIPKEVRPDVGLRDGLVEEVNQWLDDRRQRVRTSEPRDAILWRMPCGSKLPDNLVWPEPTLP